MAQLDPSVAAARLAVRQLFDAILADAAPAVPAPAPPGEVAGAHSKAAASGQAPAPDGPAAGPGLDAQPVGPTPEVTSEQSVAAEVIPGAWVPGEPPLVLVACSGGPDSLALAAVAAFEGPRAGQARKKTHTGVGSDGPSEPPEDVPGPAARADVEDEPRQATGLRVGAVVVDHGLLEGSDEQTVRAAVQCGGLGLDPVAMVQVDVDQASPDGLEAAARAARYSAMEQVAQQLGAVAVLLGHTLDDQAETVLMALTRGSGARALAGMAPARGLFRRPFLGITRAQTEAICAAEGLEPHHDPTNQPGGPYYSLRSEVRAKVMPRFEQVLGTGAKVALARTADRIRQDQDYLDTQALALFAQARGGSGIGHLSPAEQPLEGSPEATATPDLTPPQHLTGAADGPNGRVAPIDLDISLLARAHPALRSRALHLAVVAAGATAGAVSHKQIAALEALISRWHGQGAVSLPGGINVRRKCGKLEFRAGPQFGTQPANRQPTQEASLD
ncbi:MAG: tRNA lysidine(34) synthetase TilS [Bifidobacteriaceae bacterium]|jgi:tRNA(Ile)-lysidine synthetase-like protein|nr:tRNA lysidine(34) synthetase TilS [Bifidobacteriaceae bacterium]